MASFQEKCHWEGESERKGKRRIERQTGIGRARRRKGKERVRRHERGLECGRAFGQLGIYAITRGECIQ